MSDNDVRKTTMEDADSASIKFLTAVMHAFTVLRSESDRILGVYFKRLLSEADVAETKLVADKTGLLTGFSRLVRQFFDMLSHLSIFFEQWRRMCAISDVAEVVVIANSSRRLPIPISAPSAREYLATLATNSFLNPPAKHGWDKKILRAEAIFLCEPEKRSSHWGRHKTFWEQGVFLVDGDFLAFCAFLTALRFRLPTVRLLMRFRRKKRMSEEPSRRSRLMMTLAALGTDTFSVVLGRYRKISAVFFTSNSFTTEVLRAYLLRSRACAEVCEVMHGVPTIMYEQYIKALLEAGREFGSFEKHSSIGQISELPKFGVLESDVKLDTRVAINTYLNRYFFESASKHDGPAEYLRHHLESAFKGGKVDDRTLVFSFIGGMSIGPYFDSDVFGLERLAIHTILDVIKRPIVILYSPHPGHDFEIFQNNAFFQDPRIVLFPNTVFTWFVSDVSVALFSGALFEAAHFGVKTFGPMKVADDLYPAAILNLVGHQRTANFIDDLQAFAAGEAGKFRNQDILDRALERIAQLNPSVWRARAES